MANVAQTTSIAVWLCILIPFALIIAATIFGGCIYCTVRKRKRSKKAKAQGCDPESSGLSTSTATAAGAATARDEEGLNELGEAPPPYGSAEGRKPDEPEEWRGDARLPTYDTVTRPPPTRPEVMAGISIPVPAA